MTEAQKIFFAWLSKYGYAANGGERPVYTSEWNAPPVSDEIEILASQLEAEAQEMFERRNAH